MSILEINPMGVFYSMRLKSDGKFLTSQLPEARCILSLSSLIQSHPLRSALKIALKMLYMKMKMYMKMPMSLWDKIIVAFMGKKLAILGARGVGKTHLLKFLTTGSIPSEYKQTAMIEKAPARRFQIKELNLKIKSTLDLGGAKVYGEWKKLHDQADVVIYLLRADLLIVGHNEHETRVKEDLKHIADWRNEQKSRPKFFIIGTHCDLDPEYPALTHGTIGDYVDKFRKLPTIATLVAWGGGTQQVKVLLGSMKTLEDTEDLVFQLFTQMTL